MATIPNKEMIKPPKPPKPLGIKPPLLPKPVILQKTSQNICVKSNGELKSKKIIEKVSQYDSEITHQNNIVYKSQQDTDIVNTTEVTLSNDSIDLSRKNNQVKSFKHDPNSKDVNSRPLNITIIKEKFNENSLNTSQKYLKDVENKNTKLIHIKASKTIQSSSSVVESSSPSNAQSMSVINTVRDIENNLNKSEIFEKQELCTNILNVSKNSLSQVKDKTLGLSSYQKDLEETIDNSRIVLKNSDDSNRNIDLGDNVVEGKAMHTNKTVDSLDQSFSSESNGNRNSSNFESNVNVITEHSKCAMLKETPSNEVSFAQKNSFLHPLIMQKSQTNREAEESQNLEMNHNDSVPKDLISSFLHPRNNVSLNLSPKPLQMNVEDEEDHSIIETKMIVSSVSNIINKNLSPEIPFESKTESTNAFSKTTFLNWESSSIESNSSCDTITNSGEIGTNAVNKTFDIIPTNIKFELTNDQKLKEDDIYDTVEDQTYNEPIYEEIPEIRKSVNGKEENIYDIVPDGEESDSSDFSHSSERPEFSWSDDEFDSNLPVPDIGVLSCTLNNNTSNSTEIIENSIFHVASDQYIKPDHEDAESLGSNSTEGFSTRTKRLYNWFGSIGKGNKRGSSFYSTSSEPDNDPSLCSFDSVITPASEIVSQNNSNNNDDKLLSPIKVLEPVQLTPEELKKERKRKAFLVAQEMMSSEKVFVDVLFLLCNDMKEKCSSDIPTYELMNVVKHLPALLTLNQELLKDMEERIKNWETHPKISDIFVKKGKCLILYSPYYRDFEAQCKLFDELCQKYPEFSQKIKDFELNFGKKLSVKSYMLKPIQRIPQYPLLLENYLNELEPGSIDYSDTQKALEIVRGVNNDLNKALKHKEHLIKLIQIQSRLYKYNIVKPGRFFIKEGQLCKISPRRGIQERFFVLLSDCLLYITCCGTMTGLQVNYEIPLNGMKVDELQTEDHNHDFSITSSTRSFVLRAKCAEERKQWVSAIRSAIKENAENIKTFLNHKSDYQNQNSIYKLGQEAPLWRKDESVTMCQLCLAEFTFVFRRHHCRSCGKVVCGYCSNFEAPLEYRDFEPHRVCEVCFKYLTDEFDDPESNMIKRVRKRKEKKEIIENENRIWRIQRRQIGKDKEGTESKNGVDHNELDGDKNGISEEKINSIMEEIRASFKGNDKSGKWGGKYVPSTLKVPANDSNSQVSNWMWKKTNRWKKYWFVLKDQVLYQYKASEDSAALKSVVLLGWNVEECRGQDGIKYVFRLTHQGQTSHLYGVDSEQSYKKWLKAMIDSTSL